MAEAYSAVYSIKVASLIRIYLKNTGRLIKTRL
jgi:hypothetical protein